MPNRIVREGILTSERINSLGALEEVFYRRLMSVVDDFGRFHAHYSLIRAACYPLKLDKVSDSDIGKWLLATEKAALVRTYLATDGKRYLEVLDFRQQVRAKESRFPAPAQQPLSECVAPATHTHSNSEASAHLDVDVDVSEGGGDRPPAATPIPFAKIVDAFNSTLTKLPKVREVTEKRKAAIRRAWNESPTRQSLAFWQALAEEYADDPFTNGTGPYRNGHENWRPDFDYLLRSEVITKTYEKAMHRLESQA